MATFESLSLVKYPREAVFEATRDALPLAVAHVGDIERVVVQRRVEGPDGTVELTNVWYASMGVPRAIAAIVLPHMLVWTDRSIWTDDDKSCRWSVRSSYFPDHVRCSGTTRFDAAGAHSTRVALSGEILVEPRGLLGVPEVVERAVAAAIEEFVCAMFPPLLRKVIDGVSRHISDITHLS